jgi:hypothetical protein
MTVAELIKKLQEIPEYSNSRVIAFHGDITLNVKDVIVLSFGEETAIELEME